MMGVRGSSVLLLARQMEVNGKRQEPARDAHDSKRDDLSFDSACNLHSVCAV
jgi:hypothetical protein